jgi:hypothetical protein
MARLSTAPAPQPPVVDGSDPVALTNGTADDTHPWPALDDVAPGADRDTVAKHATPNAKKRREKWKKVHADISFAGDQVVTRKHAIGPRGKYSEHKAALVGLNFDDFPSLQDARDKPQHPTVKFIQKGLKPRTRGPIKSHKRFGTTGTSYVSAFPNMGSVYKQLTSISEDAPSSSETKGYKMPIATSKGEYMYYARIPSKSAGATKSLEPGKTVEAGADVIRYFVKSQVYVGITLWSHL